MTTDPNIRKRAALDFGDFDDFKPASKPKPAKKIETEIAEAEGFTSRQPKKKSVASPKPVQSVDGRSLRATGRNVQLNIAVKAETKNAFWEAAQGAGISRGEEFLLQMLEHWNASK